MKRLKILETSDHRASTDSVLSL